MRCRTDEITHSLYKGCVDLQLLTKADMTHSKFILTSIGLAAAMSIGAPAFAQIAGSSVVGVTTAESVELAYGWSAKKSILGKSIYNEAGQKIGKVEDVIVSPQKSISYAIVGAGGFAGIGRHDVAIPFSQIQQRGGKLVMAGATKDAIKQMPVFEYAKDTGRRDEFITASEKDIAQARVKLNDLQKKSGAAAADAKVKLDAQASALDADVKSADLKLGDMKHAGANRWREFEGDVRTAIDRMHKSIDAAKA